MSLSRGGETGWGRACALALVALAAGCATAPSATELPGTEAAAAQSDTRVTLAIGETVTVDGVADVTFLDVTGDSRCPADADCVWAGDATVTIRVRPPGGPPETVALHTSGAEGPTASAAGVRLTLERLDPLPTAGEAIPSDRYRAALSLSR